MVLSKNFTLSEFESSPTANRLGINNTIPESLTPNIKNLVQVVLQPAREFLGSSLNITSGYRCPELNKAIGGATTSQHQAAQAADFVCNDMTAVFNYIKDNLIFSQLIWEFGDHIKPQWIHVSYSLRGNKGEVLKAYKENGKTKYIKLN